MSAVLRLYRRWQQALRRERCLCPHTLEPGARGIYDPTCPVRDHARRAERRSRRR